MNKRIVCFPDATRSHQLAAQLNEIAPLIRVFLREEEVKLIVFLKVVGNSEKFFDQACHFLCLDSHQKQRILFLKIPEYPNIFLHAQDKIIQILRFLFGSFVQKNFNHILMVLFLSIFDFLFILMSFLNTLFAYLKYRPHGLLIQRDRNVGFSFCFLSLMRWMNKPCFLTPWGFVNTSYSVANRQNSPSNIVPDSGACLVYRWMRTHDPQQFYRHRGVTYSFFKPSKYIASKALGMCPSNPWFFGADVDICFVDSLYTKEILASNHVQSEKILVSGDPILDDLYHVQIVKEQAKRSIYKKYNCQTEKPLLIISLPHLAEHNLRTWEEHWQEIDYILGNLCATSMNILISLHPRCDRTAYAHLVKKYRVCLLEESLKQTLPAADFFVCQWSGTTIWAASLGMPTLVLGWFGVDSFGYDYLMKHVLYVQDKSRFSSALRKIITIRPQQDSKLPCVDGKASERIVGRVMERLQ